MAIDREQCVEQYRARRDEGATNAEIAAEMGVKAQTLLRRLGRWGVDYGRDNKPLPIPHGTPRGYGKKRCRCGECTEANRLKQQADNRERARRVKQGEVSFLHNASAYSNWGCRCETCCTAWTEKMRKARARRKKIPFAELEHGRASTYTTYACRCDECKDAVRRYNAARRSAS